MTGGRGPRVALVHDWLTGMRGGEKVLEALCGLFPGASVFTMVHVRGTVSPAIERLGPHGSLLSRLPGVARYYRQLLPVFPFIIEQFDVDEFDLVISSSHCAAKSVVAPRRARHLCYCFTPMRYAWDQFDAYFGSDRVGVRSRLMRPALGALARWDASTAGRPDRYVAISQYVADRIGRYYNRRSAAVVYPPVDTEFYTPAGGDEGDEGYYLVVSALVPYKRLEVAIEACARAGRRLKVVGDGPEAARLRQLAGSTVEFLGSVSDAEVRRQYRGARAVLLPGEEDFGIVPVEAQACGRPVVALGRGGSRETVVDGRTGVLVDSPTGEAFAAGIANLEQLALDPQAIRAHAVRFSRERFSHEFMAQAEQLLAAPDPQIRW
jgi:glycosyltransferase involved in cell wall biosynthesis